MEQLIEYDGNFYKILKRNFEPREIFMERVWFILKNINSKKFDDIILESYIWSNEKHLNCKYI
jgi:hypothetical protein